MSAAATAARVRDQRLDVWRGLCLVDVVLVHLAFAGLGFPEPLDTAVKHWFRFAAGGFVFLAGLTVATVFAPMVVRSAVDRRRAYERLWRRAALLAALEIGAALAYRLLDPLRQFPSAPMPVALDDLIQLLLWQRPGVTGGILLLYALILGAMPAVFELWRRAGNAAVAATSAALYAVAVATDGMHWPLGEFPVIWWQPVFFAGFVSAGAYDRMRDRPRLAATWAVAGTAAFAIAFLGYNGPSLGITLVADALPLDFSKNPLRPGALLWYLAITQVVLAWTQLAWQRLFHAGRVANVLALLGRHSLLVYTAHVFTEVPVLEVAWAWWPSAATRTAMAGLDLAALVALCAIVESRITMPSIAWARDLEWARLVRAGATVTAGAALVSTIWLHAPNTSGIVLSDLESEDVLELVDDPVESWEPLDGVTEEWNEPLTLEPDEAVG